MYSFYRSVFRLLHTFGSCHQLYYLIYFAIFVLIVPFLFALKCFNANVMFQSTVDNHIVMQS